MKRCFLLALQFFAGTSLFAAEPVFHFDFTKPASDGAIADISGQHYCTSTAPLLVEQGGLRIDYGANISIPAKSIPDVTRDFSIVLWVAYSEEIPQGVGQYQPILSKGFHDKKIDFALAIQDKLPLFVYSVPRQASLGGINLVGHTYGRTTRYAKTEWIRQEPAVAEKRWTQLAVTRTGRTLRIYKDGSLVLENPDSPKPSAPTDEPLVLGAERLRDEKDNRVTGNLLVNSLRMYDEALKGEDVKALYAREKAGYAATAPTLRPVRHYYPTEMAEYSVELDTELPMVRDHKPAPVEDSLIGKSWIEKERVGEIMTEGGSIYPLAGYPYIGLGEDRYLRQSGRFVKDFAAAQVNLVIATFARPMFWTGEDSYDWSVVDKTYQEIVNANPHVRILAGYYIAPPSWFIQRYPDELEKYYYNDAQEQAGLRQWPNSAPLASSKWADLSCRALAAFVAHVESQPYAANIIGYALPSGDAGEWYWPGSFTGGMPGYSTATTQSFREWLRGEYGGDVSALQKAWQRSDVEFENAPVPSPAERKASERWVFRDPVKARNVLDFRRFLDDTTYALVKRTTTTAKDASNWKKIVQIYYGYSLLYAGRGESLQKGGIFNKRTT